MHILTSKRRSQLSVHIILGYILTRLSMQIKELRTKPQVDTYRIVQHGLIFFDQRMAIRFTSVDAEFE